ncbi:MAG: tetratricopeptide repeat protein [Planctomycetes bacterium]|nr:tetratricopeptide repeat protein [Planctomycetota bacterium]
MRRSLLCSIVVAFWLVTLTAQAAQPPDAIAAEAKPAAVSSPLDDALQPLVPLRVRSEEEAEHLEALSLFAAGRMKEQQDDQPAALRFYQRALRHEPNALPILRAIVPLAFTLNRTEEAIRYALKAVELDPTNPLLLRRLGIHLTETGQLSRALRLYEQALALPGEKTTSPANTVLLVEMGRLYYLTEQHAKAADAFAQVLKVLQQGEAGLDPDVRKALLAEAERTYELFGAAFLAADRPQEALAAFERADQAKPNKGILAFNRARVYQETGEPEKVLEQLQVYFDSRESSRGSEPYELLAKTLESLDREAELVPMLEKLRERDGRNAPLGYHLAERYLADKTYDKAEPLYRELLRRSPASDAYQGLVRIYREKKEAGPLLLVLADAVGKASDLDVLGEEKQKLLGEAELVGALFDVARGDQQSRPDGLEFNARLAVALVALESKRFEPAGEFFDLALKANADKAGDVFLTWGMGLLVAEQYADAVKVFNRAIESKALPEDNPAFYYYLAGALAMDGKTEEALAAARTAAEIGQKLPRIMSRLPWVLYHAKRYDDAKSAYVELISKLDALRDVREARDVIRESRLIISNICVLQKRLPEAEEWLEQVLDEFPEDAGALNDLGYLWANQNKNLDRALDMVQRAVNEEPKNTSFRDSLGWVYYRLNRYEEAIAELKKAAEDAEPDPVILDHLGDTHHQLNQHDQALAAWRKALEGVAADGDAELIQKIKDKIQQHAEEDKGT